MANRSKSKYTRDLVPVFWDWLSSSWNWLPPRNWVPMPGDWLVGVWYWNAFRIWVRMPRNRTHRTRNRVVGVRAWVWNRARDTVRDWAERCIGSVG